MYQYYRRFKNQDDKGIRRIHSFENFAACGRIQLPEIKIGKFHFQICKNLYAYGLYRSSAVGNFAAIGKFDNWKSFELDDMDLQCVDIPCYQLPMCISRQRAA